MKKYLLLLFVVPVFAFTYADWVSIKIDDKVSVQFPVQPENKEMNGNAVWVSDVNKDSRCMVMLMDFTKFGMDAAQLEQEMAKEESFGQFRDGILGQIEGSKLIAEKKTKLQGYNTFEFDINMGKTDTAQLNRMYNKNIFIGSKMYSLSFYEKNNKPQTEERNKFFNSFKVN
ncbi:MAG TPA: hypothetical protein VHK91_03785 [Flavisolibacter sp.]|jgi:hypothetical protein|nr:hypothetical protein [Flavisolibacter sp.]